MSPAPEHMDDSDSPWLSDDEQTPADPIAQQEWTRLSSRYSDAGYRDGITAGKTATLQAGFDQGFSSSSMLARRVGNYRALSASLLSILTTTSGAKHAAGMGDALGERKVRVVGELRELVGHLGKLEEEGVLGVDEEAVEHAKTHESELSEEGRAKMEMRALEVSLGGMGGGGSKGVGLEECERTLERLLSECGMGDVMGC